LSWLYHQAGAFEQAVATDRLLLEDRPQRTAIYWRIDSALAARARPAERVENLIVAAEHVDLPGRRAAALHQAARICEHQLGDVGRAASLFREVLAIWPEDRYAQAALGGLLAQSGAWEELVEMRRRQALELADGPALARALRGAGTILAESLGRVDEAVAVYEELLDRLPGDHAALREMADLIAERTDRGSDQPDAASADEQARLRDLLVDVLERESVSEQPDEVLALAALRLGQTHERAGRPHEAIDAYRRAAELDRTSLLPPLAAAELAAAVDDELIYLDSLEQLAERIADRPLRSEILEETGWLWLLAADEIERAIDAMERAAQTAPERPGPHLGLALLRARSGERAASGAALAALSDTIRTPEVAAALLLRAAAIAEVESDTELLHDRLHRALDRSLGEASLVVAAEYAAALRPEEVAATTAEQLAARADLFGMRAGLVAGPGARIDWELDRAEALEAAGRLREAGQVVVGVLGNNLDDVRALQLLRRICRRGGDRAALARASLALARVLGDPVSKVELLREAAAIVDGELGDSQLAASLYRRILAEEPGAAEFERALTICREYDDVRALFELLSDRINWIDVAVRGGASPVDKVPLLHERAQLRQGLGDARGADRDVQQLLAIDAGHAGALLMRAETCVAEGDAASASDLYRRYLAAESDPERRAAAELALSDLLAESDDLAGAVAQLQRVLTQSPDDLALRERLVNLLTRAQDWPRVVEEIRAIERLGRIPSQQAQDELRVAAIYRDRIGDAAGARGALERARELDPLSAD
ncbi:MAG: hypothetical protein AAGC55_15045, partial [Myxococcota bacterium]